MLQGGEMIITGGTGMVGSAFKRVLPEAEYPNREQFHNLLFDPKGKGIIHLAANVGGV
jgi:hypothetical protein